MIKVSSYKKKNAVKLVVDQIIREISRENVGWPAYIREFLHHFKPSEKKSVTMPYGS